MSYFRDKIDQQIGHLALNLKRKWAHVFDEDVFDCLFLAGGAVSSMVRNEEVHDYDFYFTNIVDVRKRILSLFSQPDCPWYNENWEISEDGIIYNNGKKAYCNARELVHPDSHPLTPVFVTPYCVTTLGGYQFITKWFGTPDGLVSNFDFAHCMAWASLARSSLHIVNDDFLFANARKELLYCKGTATLSSWLRVRKFVSRGWKISTATMIEMALDLSRIDLTKKDILIEQLTGVDIVTTTGLINLIQEQTGIDNGVVIDPSTIRSLLRQSTMYE